MSTGKRAVSIELTHTASFRPTEWEYEAVHIAAAGMSPKLWLRLVTSAGVVKMLATPLGKSPPHLPERDESPKRQYPLSWQLTENEGAKLTEACTRRAMSRTDLLRTVVVAAALAEPLDGEILLDAQLQAAKHAGRQLARGGKPAAGRTGSRR